MIDKLKKMEISDMDIEDEMNMLDQSLLKFSFKMVP